MKRPVLTLTKTALVVAIVAIVALIVIWTRLPDVLSDSLSRKLGVAVSIRSLGAGWNEISVNKLQVANPPHSILSHALTCQRISIVAPYTHYLQNQVIIEEITLDQVYLGLEFDSASTTTGNWSTLMGRLNASKAPVKNGARPSRSVLIRKLILTNIAADVVYKKEGGSVKHLPLIPRMEFTNITSEGGVPIDQITQSVLGEMLKGVFIKQNLKNMLQNLLENQNPLNQFISPLQKFFGALPPQSEELNK